jgi:uncharacterized membrane protein HdeD (DUF308 family)
MQKIMIYIAYTAGALFILFGLAFLFTNFIPSYMPPIFKVMMGIIFILYGIFRIVTTFFKRRQENEEDEEIE